MKSCPTTLPARLFSDVVPMTIILGQAFPLHNAIVTALADRLRPSRVGDAILVPTDVMLPSGALVTAVIEGGKAGDRITVSDAGAAIAEVSDAGLEVSDRVYSTARRIAARGSARFADGAIQIGPVPVAEAHGAVVLLANLTRDVAEMALKAARQQEHSRFRERVRAELNRIFTDAAVAARVTLEGASSERHQFDYLVGLSDGRRLALDVPLPDQSSVAAVTLRQLDLKATASPLIAQAIAYDDDDHWPTATLQLLRLAGVPVINADGLEFGLRAAAGVILK